MGSQMEHPARKPLRLWPGVGLAILLLALRFVLPVVWPGGAIYGLLGAVACAPAILLWWLLLSRAPWLERLGAVVLIAAAMFVTLRFLDQSIATGGMGFLPFLLVAPGLGLAFVIWAVL